jgi:eukaryotic-like serine/threonine-protein kinase
VSSTSWTFTAVPPPATDPAERLAAEMADAWRRGERRPAEHYLERHPELLDPPEGAVRLIYEEVCLRQERGEEVAAEELLGRFPHWADELAVLLDCHRLVRTRLAPPQFPEVGETLGDFRLLAELGRGRQGRVFLATQPTLADRPVVLKVTPRQDREFLSLARLQHTHIIPLHGVHDFPARNLRALCQPYYGGASLARLLDLLRPVPVAQRTGRSLLDALDRVQAELIAECGTRNAELGAIPHSALRIPHSHRALAGASYVQAVCWVGACLAEGLHYAHERGLVHLDLKPSNVLLAADAQPLLLDFHLALQPLAPGQAAPEGFGGTPGYMSPEQERACAAAREERPVPEAVDRRSDVYALGRLLYVALAGAGAGAKGTLAPLHRRNPQVSVGLSDLVHRCLAPRAADRYPDAAAVAADLRRHLVHLPLRGVPNRSLGERWRKWHHHRPHAPLWMGLLLALTAAGTMLATSAAERFRDARGALVEARSQIHEGAHREAIRTLHQGRGRVDRLPGSAGLVAEIDALLGQARRAQAARDLHAVAESLRFLAGAEVFPERELQALEAHCRTAWEKRGLVADPAAAALDAATEEQVRTDLLDLALLWADLKHRLARRGEGAGRPEEAQAILAEAEQLLGPSAALARERRLVTGAAVPPEPARGTWWEQLTLGRSLLRSGELERAAGELERAADLRPQDFWANFYCGVCAYRRGRYDVAVHAFGVAVALAPASAEPYYNRALAYAAWGQSERALRDYDRALALAPGLGAAALNRGVLHYRAGRLEQARADLERALGHGAEPATTHYNLALVHLARHDEAAAEEHLEQALRHNPAHAEARALRDRLGRAP